MFKWPWSQKFAPSKHPGDEHLLAFVDGELSGSRAERVRKHLDACWPCRTRKQKIDLAIARFVEADQQFLLGKEPPGGWRGFEARLRQADSDLALASSGVRWFRLQPALKVAFGVVLVVAVIVAGTVWVATQKPAVSEADAPAVLRKPKAKPAEAPAQPAPEAVRPKIPPEVPASEPTQAMIVEKAVEIEFALHQTGACLGGEGRVIIARNGLRVVLVPATAERTARLNAALATVDRPAWAAVEFPVASEALRLQRAMLPPANAVPDRVELAAPPAESVLREYLKNHPEHREPPNADTEAAAANLSNTVVTQASAAVREAWALRRLAQDYGARELPVNAAPKLQAMAHDHACAIREYVERAGATISLVFGQPRPPVTASAGPWPQTVQQIFRSAEDLEARVGLLFAGDASSVPADVARRLAEDPQTAAREMLALVAHIIGHLDAMSPP